MFLLFFSKFNVHISNVNIKFKDKKLNVNNDFKIILKFTIFNKITYYKKTIRKKILKKDQMDKIRKNIKKGRKQDINRFKKFIKDFKLTKLELFIDYSTEDAALTAVGTGIASIIISSIIKSIAENSKEINWRLKPMYVDENYLNLSIDCTFTMTFLSIYKFFFEKSRKTIDNQRKKVYNISV